MDAFAAAAAALVADPHIGADALYRTAAGADLPCRVALTRPQEPQQQLGPRSAALVAAVATVPQAALPEVPVEGRRLTIAGVAYVVAGPPEADGGGVTWRLPLRRA